MRLTMRQYDSGPDYPRVSDFLVRTYRTSGSHVNWLQPRWEYMHHHELVRNVDTSKIGIWECDGEVVGVVHPEHRSGTVYVELDAEHDLRRDMLLYAEQDLALSSDGTRTLRVLINDSDHEFRSMARQMGYEESDSHEHMSRLELSEQLPEPSLPASFRIASLADDDDPRKMHRLLWRGFNHEGEPPPDAEASREFMQSAPNFRKELNMVVVDRGGRFVSYCGMWLETRNRFAYIEPVATDPDFRRLGLGQAAVVEAVRRCQQGGASLVYVGSALPFYRSLGFRPAYRLSVWQRTW